jgi:hypothetical protein
MRWPLVRNLGTLTIIVAGIGEMGKESGPTNFLFPVWFEISLVAGEILTDVQRLTAIACDVTRDSSSGLF